jgi:hypothetical protein
MSITKHVDPRRAVAYAKNPGGGFGRSVPFVVWLVLILGALMVIRKQGQGIWQPGSPLPPALATYAAAGFGIVLVSTVAPKLVTQALMVAVLLAFLIDVPYMTPFFNQVNAKIATLSPA